MGGLNMLAKLFKGTTTITNLILKQNRVKMFICLFSLTSVTLLTASSYASIYKAEDDMMGYALTAENPAMVAMIGPGYDLDDYNTATIFVNEMLLFTIIAVAVMNILFVGRATRADEEDGQMELVRALSVGRLSYLTASFLMAMILNILLVALISGGLAILHLSGMNIEGTLLYGSVIGSSGLLFAGITALFAQLSGTSRGATGLSFGILIVFYLLRAIGDTGTDSLSFISPLGWGVRGDIFVDNNWWPVILSLFAVILLLVITFYLNSIRDMGTGFLPERKGRATAGSLLQTPIGLSWRLNRTNIISWSACVFVLSASFGSVLGDLEAYFANMDMIQAFLQADSEATMTDQFISLLIRMMSLVSAVPAIMIIMKLKTEESKNHIELLYSLAISRTRLLINYITLAIVTSIFMQTFIVFGLWSIGSTVMEEDLTFGTIAQAAYVYLPAIWLFVSLATLLLGIGQKMTNLIWFYFVYCFFILYLGGLLDLPNWLRNLSIFKIVPKIPIEKFALFPISSLLIGSVIAIVVGCICYARRDLVS